MRIICGRLVCDQKRRTEGQTPLAELVRGGIDTPAPGGGCAVRRRMEEGQGLAYIRRATWEGGGFHFCEGIVFIIRFVVHPNH